jgi:hypothetical protein
MLSCRNHRRPAETFSLEALMQKSPEPRRGKKKKKR